MKVFSVMVLVLLAGAVPSHGRTESEVTVLNKTQPHESMNNVTVSSIKLVSYRFLHLAMQWPKSFCNVRPRNRPCPQQFPSRFNVHGLWAHYGWRKPGKAIDCTNLGSSPSIGRQPDGSLEFGLNQYWPNLKTTADNNRVFWVNEYKGHGSCTFVDQVDYFYHSLSLAASLGDLALKLSLLRPGIFPGYLYKYDDIRNAVHRVTNVLPWLFCNGHLNSQLFEIRFCAVRDSNGIITLVDCEDRTNCPSVDVYFP